MRFLARLVLNGLAIIIAAWLLPGIHISSTLSALVAGVILGFVNAIVRPVLFFLTLPLTLLTLGLFIFVLNAFCLWLTSRIVPGVVVQTFGAALLGALVVSIVSWLLTAFVSDAGRWHRMDRRA
jgi:putative membrane protein